MIAFWSRKEVYSTRDPHKYAAVCDVLTAEGIKYTVKCKNLFDGVVQNTRRLYGETSLPRTNIYSIYVRRKDAGRARRVIIHHKH